MSHQRTIRRPAALITILLGLLAALVELPLPRSPPALPAFVHELGAVLLENRHSIKMEFVVLGEQAGTARDHHGRQALVGVQKLFHLL